MLRVKDMNVSFLFKDGMKEVELECLCYDANEIESGVEVDDNDAIVCEVKDDSSHSRLYGAPPGWSAPSAEPLFEDADNSGGWTNYTFRRMFEQRGGKYICHAMPAGAVPVPIDAVTGKREAGGYQFFYQGWKEDNPTRENCRFGATRGNLFPADRDVTLDVTFFKKMGLSKQNGRM